MSASHRCLFNCEMSQDNHGVQCSRSHYCYDVTEADTVKNRTCSHRLAKGVKSQAAPGPQACLQERKEIRGECPDPEGLHAASAEPQLLTESLVVVASFVCPNKSLDFDNVIYLRNREEMLLVVCPPEISQNGSHRPCFPRDSRDLGSTAGDLYSAFSPDASSPGTGSVDKGPRKLEKSFTPTQVILAPHTE